ncbi:MAG: ribosomal subunit interface protein [Bacteroidetes bacterium MedPE-SWsnd-G2]|nr:MAG: ribosomal subunit interface protein [Bacteroidetes bacterium MedPE-SWsnd-G2]
MTINIQYVQIPVSETMSEYVTEKLEKLSSKYDWIISAVVAFKHENSKIDGKVCSIELSAPGPRLFAKADTDNYEQSVKDAISELEKQLKKRKEVFSHH